MTTLDSTNSVVNDPPVKPSQGRRLWGSVFIYGMGRFIPQLLSLFLVPVYSYYLTPEAYGIVELCVISAALLSILGRLGLPGSISRFYVDHETVQQTRDHFVTVTSVVMGATLGVVVLSLLLGPMIWQWLFPGTPVFPYLLFVVADAFLQQVFFLQYRLLQAREQAKIAATLSIATTLLTLVGNIALVVILNLGAIGLLMSMIVGRVFQMAVLTWIQRQDFIGTWRLSDFKQSIWYGLPLVPHHLASWGNLFLNRVLLSVLAGFGPVGHLTMAAQVTSPISLVASAFSQAYNPVYFSWRTTMTKEEALGHVTTTARGVAIVGAVAVLGAATFGGWVVRHLLHPQFLGAVTFIGLVGSARLFSLLYFQAIAEVFYNKKTHWMPVVFTVATAVNVGAFFALIHHIGPLAAGVGDLASACCGYAIALALARQTFPMTVPIAALNYIVVMAGGGIAWSIAWPGSSPLADFGWCALVFSVPVAIVGILERRILAQAMKPLWNRLRRRPAR